MVLYFHWNNQKNLKTQFKKKTLLGVVFAIFAPDTYSTYRLQEKDGRSIFGPNLVQFCQISGEWKCSSNISLSHFFHPLPSCPLSPPKNNERFLRDRHDFIWTPGRRSNKSNMETLVLNQKLVLLSKNTFRVAFVQISCFGVPIF